MSKINTLFEVISEIDDNVVSSAVKAEKIHIGARSGLIAAAAVTAAILVGFTFASRSGVKINSNDTFDYNIWAQEDMILPTKAEMAEWGANDCSRFEEGFYCFDKYALPSELFEMFNVNMLLNDSFSEEITLVQARGWTDGDEIGHDMRFSYSLTDNQLGIPVEFQVKAWYEEGTSFGLETHYRIDKDISEDHWSYEIVTLSDGSKAMITDYEWGVTGKYAARQSTADFSYNGMVYYLTADTDKDGMKRILADLGIY